MAAPVWLTATSSVVSKAGEAVGSGGVLNGLPPGDGGVGEAVGSGGVPDDGLPPGEGGLGICDGGTTIPGGGGNLPPPPRPSTPICNVGTRDIPVSNTMDNTMTDNFDILFGLRLMVMHPYLTDEVIYKIIDSYHSII